MTNTILARALDKLDSLKENNAKNDGIQFEKRVQIALLDHGLTACSNYQDLAEAGLKPEGTLVHNSNIDKNGTRRVDIFIKEIDAMVECKYQGKVRGTTHEKLPSVIFDLMNGEYGVDPVYFLVYECHTPELHSYHESVVKWAERLVDVPGSNLKNFFVFNGIQTLLDFLS